MKILTALSTLGLSPDDNELWDDLEQRLNELLKADNSEFGDLTITELITDPETIKRTASTWNQDIKRHFIAVFTSNVMTDGGLPNGESLYPENMEVNNPWSFEVKQAAINLDGEYTPYGNFLVIYKPEYIFQEPILMSCMTNAMLSTIKNYPEKYIVIDSTIENY